jgi:hypothetical protein
MQEKITHHEMNNVINVDKVEKDAKTKRQATAQVLLA